MCSSSSSNDPFADDQKSEKNSPQMSPTASPKVAKTR